MVNNWKKIRVEKGYSLEIDVGDLIDKGYLPLSFRFLMLQSYYNSYINFIFEVLSAAEVGLKNLNKEYYSLPILTFDKVNKYYVEEVRKAIFDNLNTSKVLALSFKFLKDNNLKNRKKRKTLKYINKLLGLLDKNVIKEEKIPKNILQLATKRQGFRKNRDYKNLDKIREEINKLGYDVLDERDGFVVVWKR